MGTKTEVATLQEAKAQCWYRSDCGGITRAWTGKYQLRAGTIFKPERNDEESWLKVVKCTDNDAAACLECTGDNDGTACAAQDSSFFGTCTRRNRCLVPVTP